MRELAIQSANATNSNSDKDSLDKEFGELAKEIQRVLGGTSFNGKHILGSDAGTQTFQVGANTSTDDSISITTTKMTTDSSITTVAGTDNTGAGRAKIDSTASASTIATVIASQAVITGAYSLTRQAIQLGLLPRFEIRHTSEAHSGQIYIPRINMLLLVAVMLLVLMFRSSSALASAYGISVTGTMVVTGMMGFVVVWRVWKWSPFAAAALIAPFLFLDLTFLAANLLKVLEGGWVPLALGAVVMLLMYTWRRGSRLLFDKSRKLEFPLAELVAMLEKRPPQRVPGTAVFLTSDPVSAPTALMHSLKHYKVLHEKNVILTIETASTPRIDPAERVRLEQVGATFTKVTLRFGFMESPNVPKALAIARKLGWQFDIMSTSFFLSRRALKPAAHSGMPRWQDHLFIALSRTANDATDYFQIPSGRVVEVGTQVTI
ncbi:flagellin [mine drainage metagenome]|uniref:Flagellin n=1 Tax=mine drainage metagenome TaxID=410659 RepID=A0A1J5PP79_9ZZZZ